MSIKRDLYCFKNGRLELSILDECLEEECSVREMQETVSQDDLQYISLGYKKFETSLSQPRGRDVLEDHPENSLQGAPEVPLKVSEEIYNTLKTMGEFLTQTEVRNGQELEIKRDKNLNSSPSNSLQEASPASQDEVRIDENSELRQSYIDALLREHFGEVTPKFQYALELKEKIENQIKKIKDY